MFEYSFLARKKWIAQTIHMIYLYKPVSLM